MASFKRPVIARLRINRHIAIRGERCQRVCREQIHAFERFVLVPSSKYRIEKCHHVKPLVRRAAQAAIVEIVAIDIDGCPLRRFGAG